MKLLDRLSNLVKSNLNSAIDKMSDPAKEIDLLIEEMEEESRRSRREVRDQLAREKLQHRKVEEAYRNVMRWQEHAERAVSAGDDEMAKEALRRQKEAENALEEEERALAEQSRLAAQLTEQMKRNDKKIAEIKSRKETLKAKARQSKQAASGSGTAFERFDQLVSEIELSEHQADAMVEMMSEPDQQSRDRETNARFDRLLAGKKGGPDRELDDRLAALKAKLDKRDGGA